jgi:hypothetical protein
MMSVFTGGPTDLAPLHLNGSPVLEDFDNPYQPPQILLEPERDDALAGYYRWLKFFIVLQMLVVLVGLGVSFSNIYSILVSGPTLSIVGLLTAILCWRRGPWWGLMLGGSGPLFSILIFALINVLDWGPQDAESPVPKFGLGYLCIAGSIAFITWIEIRNREKATRL